MNARLRNIILLGVLAVFLAQVGGLVLIKAGTLVEPLRIILLRGAKPIIEIKAETLWSVGPLEITNTLFTAWIVIIFLIAVAYASTRKLSIVPTGLQNLVEVAIEALYNLVVGTVGEKHGRRFFPVIATIFLYVVIANWFALLPFFNAVGKVEPLGVEEKHFHEEAVVFRDAGISFVPLNPTQLEIEAIDESACEALAGEEKTHCVEGLRAEAIAAAYEEEGVGEGETAGVLAPYFRSVNTDLMSPLSLAIVSAIFVEFWGISALGVATYGGKFFNISRLRRGDLMGIIDLFVGVLEFIAEVARLISFTFRLFGNMLAGEILLLVMTFLIPLLLALPFYGLELFVGAIQAFVFAMLTLVFGALAVSGHGDEHHGEEPHPAPAAEVAAAHEAG